MNYNNFSKIQSLALTGMFGAIIFILTFTPLGFPQIPFIGSATIIHIPVIIGAILMGPKYGAILGFMFGLSSMIFATTQSVALNAFAFTPFRPVPGTDSGSPWALLIAFVPRIIVGILPPLVFVGLTRIIPQRFESKKLTSGKVAVAAVTGSITNTLIVLHLMYFLFREPWSYAREGPAAIAREAVAVANSAALSAWESAIGYTRAAISWEAVYYPADMSITFWETAAEYARTAVGYEQAAAATLAGINPPQVTYAVITGIIAGFGVPEAIAAGIITPAVCMALFAVSRRMPGKSVKG